MSDAAPPRLTLRQRWHRLRTSPRFPFVLFLGLLVAGGLSQVYCYWWGVRIQRMLARNGGGSRRVDLFPPWIKQSLGKHLEPLEPIRQVQLWGGISTNRAFSGDDLRILRGALFLRELHLFADNLSSASREQLGCLTQLQTLGFQVVNVTTADVIELSKLPRLDTLLLGRANPLDFEIYKQLAEMPQLKNLTIAPKGAGAIRGLRDLARSQSLQRLEGRFSSDELLLALTDRLPDGGSPLPSLRELRLIQNDMSISHSNVTDAGLANLRHLPGLVHLDLSETKVTSEGLRHLISLPNLKTLYLAHCPLSQEEVAVLAEMHNLESLNIESTSMSEESLMKLASLPRLRRFRITYASHEILSKVQHRLPPGCKFVHY